jgi:hypothetical protein
VDAHELTRHHDPLAGHPSVGAAQGGSVR